jgi:hypothetical protein
MKTGIGPVRAPVGRVRATIRMREMVIHGSLRSFCFDLFLGHRLELDPLIHGEPAAFAQRPSRLKRNKAMAGQVRSEDDHDFR